MTSQPVARTEDQSNDDAPEGPGRTAFFAGSLAIGAAFVAGAALIYRVLFAALMHVR